VVVVVVVDVVVLGIVVVLALVDVVVLEVVAVVLALVEVVLALVLVVGGSSPGQMQGGLEQEQGFSSPVHLLGFLLWQ